MRHRWADKQHWFSLLAGENNLMRSADAVHIGRAICHDKIAGVHHSEVAVQRGPKLRSALGALGSARLVVCKRPIRSGNRLSFTFFAVIVHAAHFGLKPRIKDSNAEPPEELPNSVSPTVFLLILARTNKVHGPGKIYARIAKQVWGRQARNIHDMTSGNR
jgi:hypothetical protein